MNKIKEFFTSKTFHEKMNGKHKEIVNYHFDNIEWNIQTTVYGMLTRLFNELDEKHLKDIADLYNKNGNIEQISAQLDDAILDVLKSKKLIKGSNGKNDTSRIF
jgi:hypothetical protein